VRVKYCYEQPDSPLAKTPLFSIRNTLDLGLYQGIPQIFTVTAIAFYERALAAGHKPAALGVSDSHNAGRTPNKIAQAPIGTGTTAVYAEELSEPGVECGVEAGHTYAKVTGNAGPDLRFEAVPRPGSGRAIMGDTVRAPAADFAARVIGGDGTRLRVIKNGSEIRAFGVGGDDVTERFGSSGPGWYRLQVERGATIETVSTPIWLEPGPGRVLQRDCSPLRVRGLVGPRRRVRRGRLVVRCRASGAISAAAASGSSAASAGRTGAASAPLAADG
jgi:hypothetical protein